MAWRGLSDAYRAAVTGHTALAAGFGRRPEPICVPDVREDAVAGRLSPGLRRPRTSAPLHFFPLIYRRSRDRQVHAVLRRAARVLSRERSNWRKRSRGQIAFGVARIRAEEALERERERLRFLAEASAMLASSLDYERTMQRVAELIVPDSATGA